MNHALATFLWYFSPLAAGMFVFGLIHAVKHVLEGDENKTFWYGVISTIGFLTSLRTLVEVITW